MTFEQPKPLITTVIPTYRRPHLLERAIRSVLKQTYPHFQVYVCDNASGDNTASVVARIAEEDPRVKYFCQKKNIGSIPNFNFGMNQVTTPFFSLLSDDNILLPNFYEMAIQILHQHPEAALFAGQTISVNENNRITKISLKQWPAGLINPPEGLLSIWEKGLPTWEGLLFRREIIDKIGLLNPEVYGSADQEFIMRILRNHSAYLVKTVCAIFMFHSNSETIRRDLGEVVASQKKILAQWTSDNELSAEFQSRLEDGYKYFIKSKITTYLYYKSIVGKERQIITTARSILRKEIGFSFKPVLAILVAQIVNYNKILKKLLPAFITNYIAFKDKFLSLN